MQERVGERRLLPKVGGLVQNVFQRMTRRQCPERSDKIPNMPVLP